MANLSGEARISPDVGQESTTEGHRMPHDLEGDVDGYVFSTPADIKDVKMQRQAIWELVKSLGAHLLRDGVNLTKVSLPVKVFEPRSFLERITDSFSCLHLLDAAAATVDPVLRMQYLVGFVVGGLRRQTSTLKPFNPILGETYEAAYEGGVRVWAEQISHHPPISSWQVMDHSGKFHFYGCGQWRASARGNAIRGQQCGRNCVRFASDGALVTWELPPLLLRGILWGVRSLKYSGTITFVDSMNDLRCEVALDSASQSGGLIASWWRGKRGKADQLRGVLRKQGAAVNSAHGSWLTSVTWDSLGGERAVRQGGGCIWDAATSKVHAPKPVPEPLPSDCRFRQDLQALKGGDLEAAQAWKAKMEAAQRQDAALRAAAYRGITVA